MEEETGSQRCPSFFGQFVRYLRSFGDKPQQEQQDVKPQCGRAFGASTSPRATLAHKRPSDPCIQVLNKEWVRQVEGQQHLVVEEVSTKSSALPEITHNRSCDKPVITVARMRGR